MTDEKDWNRLLFLAGIFVFSALLIATCFFGLSPAGPEILPDRVARFRVVAERSFDYESTILTEQLREQRKKRVPPVYRLNLDPHTQFSQYINELIADINHLEEKLATASFSSRQDEAHRFLSRFDPNNRYNLNSDDIVVLFNTLPSNERLKSAREGLMILRDIYREGIYDANNPDIRTPSGNLGFYHIHRESGHIAQAEVQSEVDALRSLRINLSALDIPREGSVALYRVLRTGLSPNLQFDPVRTEEKEMQALANIRPVVINVPEGQTIIEPGLKVTRLDHEQLNAYRTVLRESEEATFLANALFWERVLMTIVIMLSASIYIQIGSGRLHRQYRRVILSATVILLNLAAIRIIVEIGSSDILRETGPTVTVLLPYLAPTALGPIAITIMIGAAPGIFVAVLICLFNALMQGNSIPMLLITVLASLVGIYSCRNIQVRNRVVQAGALSGLTVAGYAFFIGLFSAHDIVITVQEMTASLVLGVFTGIAVVGILPVLENLFKITTDISLLELTDFNHPLLRRMQVEAPGSYHHSLMVANLSENAAAAIGANPLICRVCALFHDIGKTIKPDYFAENQNQGENPHIQRNPSMSALVIKSHIKEGVSLARQYRLPQIIVDVIRQHHGTTLIQYFYYKALKQRRRSSRNPFFPNAPSIEIDKVNESTYRYEGPKPGFKDSAVVFFADSIEAAGRCLPKVTPQAIDELLDKIFQDRLDDNQLSECPLTFEEVHKIKESFSFTLLNMLHARVDYPTAEEQQRVIAGAEAEKKGPTKPDTDKSNRGSEEPADAPKRATETTTPATASPRHVEREEKTANRRSNQPA